MKIGRNAPCPCGSGKKYKRCHLNPPVAEETSGGAAERSSGSERPPGPLAGLDTELGADEERAYIHALRDQAHEEQLLEQAEAMRKEEAGKRRRRRKAMGFLLAAQALGADAGLLPGPSLEERRRGALDPIEDLQDGAESPKEETDG